MASEKRNDLENDLTKMSIGTSKSR